MKMMSGVLVVVSCFKSTMGYTVYLVALFFFYLLYKNHIDYACLRMHRAVTGQVFQITARYIYHISIHPSD